MWVPFFARGRAISVRGRTKTLDALQYDEYKSSQSIYVTPDDTRAVMGLASRALRASNAVALTCAHVFRVCASEMAHRIVVHVTVRTRACVDDDVKTT